MADLSLMLRLQADASRFVRGLTTAQGGVRRFEEAARQGVARVRAAFAGLEGLAGLALGAGVGAVLAQSARLDRDLIKIGQTAGTTAGEVDGLRDHLFTWAATTGAKVEDLQAGFNAAVASGLKFSEAIPTLESVNKAVAVTGARAETLTGALTVAGTAFSFDLAKPGQALELLDKMTVAGRLGNAELESLADIYARIGVNAASVGMTNDKTLAFIETLSKIERQPERLATLADSTLRLFSNTSYMEDAAQATGVKFFNPDKSRRDVTAVLGDIRQQFAALKTDAEKTSFISAAFGKADQETQKGIKALLQGNLLDDMKKFEGILGKAGGSLERDLPAALNNAADQAGRLKAALAEAADGFARPINDILSNTIRWAMDSEKNGGLGLDGQEMLAGGAALGLGAYGLARLGGGAISALAGGMGSLAGGVAQGAALQAATGTTPVFVVNWPANLGGTLPLPTGGAAGAATPGLLGRALAGAGSLLSTPVPALAGMGGGAMAAMGLGAAGAGAAGWAVGSALYDVVGEGLGDFLDSITRVSPAPAASAPPAAQPGPTTSPASPPLSKAVRAAVAAPPPTGTGEMPKVAPAAVDKAADKAASLDLGGTIRIQVDVEGGQAKVTQARPNHPGQRYDVRAGLSMRAPQ